ncbi:MAG: peptide-methionine (S)-S-oxide reductase MsrA [Ferruginibacter sp.]|nr:peptide-methionine (S)-S-oxide reductase MsrA [Rhodoferax sp.]
MQNTPFPTPSAVVSRQVITLGGGCFWCTEAVFVKVRGVTDVESGYCNGQARNPTYEEVCSGETGHVEVVRLEFDPAQISLRQILEVFFAIHDPTILNQQGHDVGTQYRSGVYTSAPEQLPVIDTLLAELAVNGTYRKPVVTEVLQLSNYWPAEINHQDYFANHPHHGYCQMVAAPKVEKFRKMFANLAKN